MDLILAFVVSLVGVSFYIKIAKMIGIGQLIKEDGPDLHSYKRGTPTMGGIVFTTTSAIFMVIERCDPFLWSSLLLFSLLGVVDDLSSIVKQDAYGMKIRTKFTLQILFSTVLVVLFVDKDYVTVPGIGEYHLGWWYKIFAIFLITGSSNAVNITDGLDGLSSFTSLTAFVPMFAATLLRGSADRSLLIVSSALLGFLFFNIKPARVFMGDAGSLALGAFLASSAVRNDLEIPLLLFGGIFVLETLSVIIQVVSYKTRRKRVFLMAPIHHHFELKGWSEEKVVFNFVAFNTLLSLIALGWLI